MKADDESVESFKNEIASLLLMVHDHYLRHLVGYDITLSLSRFVHSMRLQEEVSVLDVERLRFQVMGLSSYPMEFDAFFSWLRALSIFLYKGRDIGGKMAFHTFLVENLVPSVSEVNYTVSVPDMILPEDEPLKLLTVDAWLLFGATEEFFQMLYASLADDSLRVKYNSHEQTSLWKQFHENSPDGRVDSERFLMLLRLNGLVPDLISDEDADQCVLLAVTSGSRLTLQQVLYVFELLVDRSDLSTLLDVNEEVVSRCHLHLLVEELAYNLLKNRFWSCYLDYNKQSTTGAPSTSFPDLTLSIIAGAIMSVLRHAGAYSVTHQNITLQLQNSFQSFSHLVRLQQMRFRDEAAINQAWISFFRSLRDDLQVLTEVDLNSTVKHRNVTSKSAVLFSLMEFLPGLFFSPAAQPSQNYNVVPFAKLNTAESLDRFWPRVWDLTESIIANIERLQGGNFSNRNLHKFATQQKQRMAISASELRELLIDGRVLQQSPDGNELDDSEVDYIFDKAVYIVTNGLTMDQEPLLAPLHMIELICVTFAQMRKQKRRQQCLTADESVDDIIEDDDMAFIEALFQLRESTEAAVVEVEANKNPSTERHENEDSQDADSIEEITSVHDRGRSSLSYQVSSTASQEMVTLADPDKKQQKPTFKAKQIAEMKQLSLATVDDDEVGDRDDKEETFSPPESNSSLLSSASPLVVPPAPTPPAHRHHTRHRRQSYSSEIIQSISEIVRLLMHFPSLGFDPTPWQIYHVYVELLSEELERQFAGASSTSDSSQGASTTSETSNAIVTKLLKLLAERFDLSPGVFSTFFAPYYAPSESFISLLPFDTPSIADVLQTPFFNFFASENVQRLLSLNSDLLKWEYARCISCCRNSKEPFTQSLLFTMLSQPMADNAQDRYHQNMLLDYNQVAFWIGQYIKDPALQLQLQFPYPAVTVEPPFFPEFVVTSALSGLPLSFQEEQATRITTDSTSVSTSTAIATKLPRLTFSTFVIFATRSFTKHLFLSASPKVDAEDDVEFDDDEFDDGAGRIAVTEKQFLDEIRRMLRMFSTNLTAVQRVVEIHILDFLFDASFYHGQHSLLGYSSGSDDDDEIVGNEAKSLISSKTSSTKRKIQQRLLQKQRLMSQFVSRCVVFSHRIFDQRIQALSAPPSTAAGLKLPPRPPTFLWDAARFVEFVRFFHLIERPCTVVTPSTVPKSKLFQPSLTHAWTVYGYYLYQDMSEVPDMYAQLSHSFVREGHVPPLPMDIDDEKIFELLQIQAYLLDKHGVLSTSSLANRLASTNASVYAASDKLQQRKPILYEAGVAMVQEDLFPIICSFAEHVSQGQGQTKSFASAVGSHSTDGFALEDLLRLGGSVMMVKLSELQSFLQLSFYCLARSASQLLGQASSTLGEPSAIVLKHIPSSPEDTSVTDSAITPGDNNNGQQRKPTTLYEKYGGSSLEIPINVVCDFFSCRELIGAAKVAFLARESLHHRLRPPYALVDSVNGNAVSETGGASSTSYRSVVTMNYAEFEELFVRAAFQIAQQNTQRNNNSGASIFASNPATKQAYDVYQEEEKRVQSLPLGNGHWGRDFLSPYAAILQQYFQFPVVFIEDFQRLSGFQIPQIKHMAHFLHKSHQLINQLMTSSSASESMSQNSHQQLHPESAISLASSSLDAIESIANHNFSHLIADPVTRASSAAAFTSSTNGANGGSSLRINTSNNNKKKLHFSDEIGAPLALYRSPTSAKTKAFFGSGQGVASAGYDPRRPPEWATAQPGDAAAGSSSFTSKTSNSSDAAAITASMASIDMAGVEGAKSTSFLSALQFIPLSADVKQQFIHDIKESLWPVFATYCSCGDSTDPGRLSCPNLFTLLSKLGLLDDNTLVSDIGRIFYRIATKSFSREAASWSFRQLAKHQRRSYHKQQKQLQQQLQQQQQAESKTSASSVRRRLARNTTTANNESVWWIQQHGLIFEEFLLFVYAFAQLRYEQRYDLLQDEENRITCYQQPHHHQHHDQQVQQPAQALDDAITGEQRVEVEDDELLSASDVSQTQQKLLQQQQEQLLQQIYSSLPKKWHFWYDKMTASVSLQRLFYEHIQPRLTTQATLLAFPEDARYRDRFTSVFAEEVLEIIERVEGPLSSLFSQELSSLAAAASTAASNVGSHDSNSVINKDTMDKKIPIIVRALRRLELLPQVISEKQVTQLIRDVLPEDLHHRISLADSSASSLFRASPSGALLASSSSTSTPSPPLPASVNSNTQLSSSNSHSNHRMVFPQWMWILCVVALQAVRQAISREQQLQLQSSLPTTDLDAEDDERVVYLVGRLIMSITMTLTTTSPMSSPP